MVASVRGMGVGDERGMIVDGGGQAAPPCARVQQTWFEGWVDFRWRCDEQL